MQGRRVRSPVRPGRCCRRARPWRDRLRIPVVLSAAPAPLTRAFAVAPFLQQNNDYVLVHGVAAQLRAGGRASFTRVPLRDAADFDARRRT